MAKGKKSIFFCQNCGHEEAKWLGQCPACKEWNTFVEERIDSGITKGTTVAARAVHEAKVVPLTEVTADDDTRSETGIKELDRVLGGRDCTGITGTGRRRSGNWKVNTFITGMPKNGTDEKDPVYFRRGVAGTD